MKKESESRENPLIDIDVKKIKDPESLKTLGAFSSVKKTINAEIGFKIKARSWTSLFEKLWQLNRSVESNREKLKALISCAQNNAKSPRRFSDIKNDVSDVLGFRITARGWSELKWKVSNLLKIFASDCLTNKYEIYERIKRSNFAASSKLEGIEVSCEPSSKKMSDVINKYKSRS